MIETTTSADVLIESEAAAFLRIKPETLRHWRTAKRFAGKAPAYIQHGSGRVLYLRADLLAWLALHRVPSSEEVQK